MQPRRPRFAGSWSSTQDDAATTVGYGDGMARMVPATGPRTGSSSRVQDRLYDALARTLSQETLVVHAAAWVGADFDDRPRDGRADFMIADPDRGILLLDVVEGGLAHDPHADSWSTGAGEPRTDPFASLEGAADSLLAHIDHAATALPSRPVIAYAAVTADIIAPRGGFSATAPRAVVLDRSDLDDLAPALDRLFDHWAARRPGAGNASSRWWLRIVEQLFVAPVRVRALLGSRLADDREAMLALDRQQIAVLEMLSRMRQVTVYGPAGTGKTVLAVAKARRLAEQGYRVLLTCYNRALGAHLKSICADQPRITALHFHELCYLLLNVPAKLTKATRTDREARFFFDEQLPAQLIAASSRLKGYDAVVVDEGQDFRPSYWRALESISRGGDHAIRYIFYDNRQRLHKESDGPQFDVPGAEFAIVLRTNWRNTKHIHGHIGTFEPPFRDTPCAAPAGVPVQHNASDPSAAVVLRRTLSRLVREEGVRPDDIAILTGRGRLKSKLVKIGGDVPVGEMTDSDTAGKVRIGTIHAFKGLESPVVILAELDHLPPSERRRLHYVGASRAMSLLIVLSSAEVAPEAGS